MVIVDTTVWVDYLRGTVNPETNWLNRELDQQRLGITDLILCEVLQGIVEESAFVRVLRELRRLEVIDAGGIKLAVAAAQNYRLLRRRGQTVRKTNDCLIATFCIRGGHSLLHRDRDYDSFERLLGLSVVHP
ncbi:MAG TPA: PIN domain nuclease [Terriglobales bacterium]|nr:PIN domain nuclease [Terriglobales bacterium]